MSPRLPSGYTAPPPKPGLLSRLAGFFQSRAMPAWWSDSSVGWNLLRGEAPGQFQATGREARILGWERNAVVQACVRVVAEELQAVPFEAYEKDAGGEERELPDHPIITELLERSDFAMSGTRRRGLLAVHYQLYGNAALVIERQGGVMGLPNKISRLRLVHPEDISYCFFNETTDAPVSYQWRDRGGRTHYEDVANFIHFRDLAGGDWAFGYPRGAAALLEMATDQEGSEYVRQMLKNYGAPGVAVLTEGSPQETELKAAKAKWQEEYATRGGRGSVQFMTSVKDIKVIGFNLRDLEFPDMRAISREGICAVFNVDPRMISIGSAKGADGGLSGQQYVEARRRLIQQAVLPLMKALEAELNNWLTPEFGNVYVRFSPKALEKLTADAKEISERARAELTSGGISREEFRQMTGRDPEMDPTDTLVGTTGRSEYLVSDAIEHGKPRDPFAGFGGGALPPGNGNGAPPKQLPPGKGEDEPVEGRTRFLTRGLVLTKERRNLLWAEFDARATASEAPYRSAAVSLFQQEREACAAAFGLEGRAVSETSPAMDPLRRVLEQYQKPNGPAFRNWLERYRALISETVNVAGGMMADNVGLSFDLKNPRVQTAIRNRAELLATHVTEETARQITAIVATGQDANLGVRDIAKLIDEAVFAGQAPMRAERIARTESIGALNEGELVAARELEIFEEKEWLSQGDDRVRLSHAELDGKRVAIAQDYAPNLAYPGDQRAGPEEVVNCRCGQLFYSVSTP